MADWLGADPESILAAAPPFQRLAGDVADVVNTLQSRLSALGKPWGDDETGRMFEEGYLENSEDFRDGIGNIQQGLSGTADGLTTMGRGFEATEEGNRSAINLGGER
jgi:uncharacterized protein YukE